MRLTKQEIANPQMRFRHWQSILYLDSCAENWKDKLVDWGVQAFISPLHQYDINGDGSPKKPHHHIVVSYQNKKSFWQVNKLFEDIGALNGIQGDGKSAFMTCEDLRVSVRYLCHLDNPEKYQYPIDEVVCIGGADFDEVATLPRDDEEMMGEILTWMHDYQCFSYRALIVWARDNDRKWFKYLNRRGSRHVWQIMKSAQWELEHYGTLDLHPTAVEGPDGKFYDRKTGEEVSKDDL